MTIKKALPYLFTIFGAVGELFSILIMIEKYNLAVNPAYLPPCSINPLLSCVTIMNTWQASAFGFPNPILGIAGFAIIMTIGIAMLAGASFRRWFWLGTQLGLALAVCFVYWLFFESVFAIGALCPFCMVVWSVTIPAFLYVTVFNLGEGHLVLSRGMTGLRKIVLQYHWAILGVMYGVIAVSIFLKLLI